MFELLGILIQTVISSLNTRRDLALENLTLRQWLAVLNQEHPRPRLMVLSRVDPVEWGTTVMFRI